MQSPNTLLQVEKSGVSTHDRDLSTREWKLGLQKKAQLHHPEWTWNQKGTSQMLTVSALAF